MGRAVDDLVDAGAQHFRAAGRRVVPIQPAGEEGDVQPQLQRRPQRVEPGSGAVRLHKPDAFHVHTSVLSVGVTSRIQPKSSAAWPYWMSSTALSTPVVTGPDVPSPPGQSPCAQTTCPTGAIALAVPHANVSV